MFRKCFVTLLLSSLIFLPSIIEAALPVPARIGGTVTVNGTQLTQATDAGYAIKVTDEDGITYTPAAKDTNGLNSSGCYIIDIPIFDATDQLEGANPGDTVVIHVFRNSSEMTITSPVDGKITVGDSGTITQIDLAGILMNQKPVADAGLDQTISLGNIVSLDGSGSSDSDGDALIYQWTFSSAPAGSSVILSNPAGVNPSFQIDVAGDYVIQLIVNDGTEDSDPDTVTVTTYIEDDTSQEKDDKNSSTGIKCFIQTIFGSQ
jgi:hypothetical protein